MSKFRLPTFLSQARNAQLPRVLFWSARLRTRGMPGGASSRYDCPLFAAPLLGLGPSVLNLHKSLMKEKGEPSAPGFQPGGPSGNGHVYSQQQ